MDNLYPFVLSLEDKNKSLVYDILVQHSSQTLSMFSGRVDEGTDLGMMVTSCEIFLSPKQFLSQCSSVCAFLASMYFSFCMLSWPTGLIVFQNAYVFLYSLYYCLFVAKTQKCHPVNFAGSIWRSQ